jgi:hypothetical protein
MTFFAIIIDAFSQEEEKLPHMEITEVVKVFGTVAKRR